MNIKRLAARIGSIIGLILTVIPSVLVWTGGMTWDRHVRLMAVGMLLWFALAPTAWKKRRSSG